MRAVPSTLQSMEKGWLAAVCVRGGHRGHCGCMMCVGKVGQWNMFVYIVGVFGRE